WEITLQPPGSASGTDQRFCAGLLDCAFEALTQAHFGLPSQDLPGQRNVGLTDLRVVDGKRLEHDLRTRSRHLDYGLGQFEQRVLLRVADVDGIVVSGFSQRDQPADLVGDVTERAG